MTIDQLKRIQDRLQEALASLKLDQHPSTDFLFKTTDARCALAWSIGFLGSIIEDAEGPGE